MDWIFDNIQILIGVAAAIAYWITNLRHSKQEAEEPHEEVDPEEIFGPDFDYNQPADEPPQWLPPPLPQVASVPPPLVQTPLQADGELQRQEEMMERLKRLREERAMTTGGAAVAKARAARKGPAAAGMSSVSLKRRLRQRGEVRRAVVLREILDRPLGLR